MAYLSLRGAAATALVGLGAAGLTAGPASALNYVTNANGDTWAVQDAAVPGVDTGSVRNTSTGSLQGYGGLRIRVTDSADRMDGALMRGFGLTYDGTRGFRSRRAVEVGGVAVSRALRIDPDGPWLRYVDTVTNTTKQTKFVDVAFGGQLGYDAGSNQSTIDATASGDTEITAADGWVSSSTPSAGPGSASFNGPSATVIGTGGLAGALTRTGTLLRDPFANALPTTGDEANHLGLVNRVILAPSQTVTLARFVVTGLSETRPLTPGAAVPAAGSQTAAVRTLAASLAADPPLDDLSLGERCALVNWDEAGRGASAADCARAAPVEPLTEYAAPAPPVTSSPYDVVGKSLTELQADMRSGATNAEQVVQAYLDRIAAYDRGPWGLNAVITTAPDALAQARAADAARRAGDDRPLLGIPVLVKDIFDTADMPTTGASRVFDDYQPTTDAWQVAKLREAGAIILGKANLAEFATDGHFSPSAFGQVWNAFDPSRSPIGSSGGSAAALAASMGAVTLGTQTGDSLWGPAGAASLVSLRGTDGMQSTDGVMPLTLIQDYAGVIARTLPDLATTLDAVAVGNPGDPLDDVADGRRPTNWGQYLREDALRGTVVGVPATAFDDPFRTRGTEDAMRAQFANFEAAGATVKEIPDPPSPPAAVPGDRNFEGWRQWLAAHPNSPWQDVLQITRSPLRLPLFRNTTPYTGTGAMTPEEVRGFQDYRAEYRRRLEDWMTANGVDTVVFPAQLSDIHLNDSIQPSFGRRDPQSSASGVPTVIFPAGVNDHGQPINLQLQGRSFSDGELLGYAYAFEAVADGHVESPLSPPLRYAPGVETALPPAATPVPEPETTPPASVPPALTEAAPVATAPAGPAAPADPATFRRLTVVSRRATLGRSGRFPVAVGCASGEAACTGTLRVTRSGRTVASARVRVAAGRVRTVRVRVRGADLRSLRRGARVAYRIQVIGRSPTRSAATTTLRVSRR